MRLETEAVKMPLEAPDLTPAWLTATLRAHGVLSEGAIICGVSATKVGTGQLSACHSLVLDYLGDAGTAPSRILAKLASTDAGTREFASGVQSYTREVNFYREIAPTVGVRVPVCYHAAAAEDGQSFVLLLEDLAPATECEQLRGCSVTQAMLGLEQAAALHGRSWAREDLAGLDWLRSGFTVWHRFAAGAEQIQTRLRARYGDVLEDEFLALGDQLAEGGTAQWVARMDEPICLWHCDYRLDNLLFDAGGGEVPIAVLDWQSVMLARGTSDASYFVGAGLSVEDRREHEEDLLRHYHAALLDHGVRDYDWDACWEDYRVNSIAGFLTAAVSSVSVERTERGDQMFLAMLRRHGQQMLDHDALAALSA